MSTIASCLSVAERDAMHRAARTGKSRHGARTAARRRDDHEVETVSLDELREDEADDEDEAGE